MELNFARPKTLESYFIFVIATPNEPCEPTNGNSGCRCVAVCRRCLLSLEIHDATGLGARISRSFGGDRNLDGGSDMANFEERPAPCTAEEVSATTRRPRTPSLRGVPACRAMLTAASSLDYETANNATTL